MLTIAIIDDEADARAILHHFLSTLCPDVQIVGEASNAAEGVALLRQKRPDVVLLDIQLGEQTGFDLLNKFNQPNFQVIFITAYQQFAIQAFAYCALDYLLKPIDPDQLLRAIDKAQIAHAKNQVYSQQLQQLQQIQQTKTFDKIVLPTAEGLVLLRLSEVLYLQADVNYTLFFTTHKEKFIVSKPLKEFEALLPKHQFCRSHQSYIVNIQYIKKILREDGGYILLGNGERLPISRRKKERLLSLLLA
ncbi:MAG: LytTR family DNA-binding domain-containing protein [Bacteroidota bacterium]